MPTDGDGSTGRAVADHYAGGEGGDLTERLLSALRDRGVGVEDLSPADLSGVSEFHVQGREGTRSLADLLDPAPGDRVVDLAAGLGGPARTLAADRDCRVAGVDLTPAYCRAARDLTRRVGLDARVDFHLATALELPFRDGRFDAAWSQHLLANVADDHRLVEEVVRVLRPGGRLAVHEVFAGPGGHPRYPLPFATDERLDCTGSVDRFRSILAASGFETVAWEDVTAETVAWYDGLFEKLGSLPEDATPPPGLDVVMGPRFGEMTRTMAENLRERRLVVYRGVFALPGP